MNWCDVTTTNSCASSSNIVRHQVALHLIVSYMKTVLSLLIAGFLATACSPKAQLVTLRATNLRPVTDQGLVMDTDTLTLRYSFTEERGQMHILLVNKLNRPLYVDWKRSSFIIGKEKLDYWHDVADVNLNTSAVNSWHGRYTVGSINGVISKDDAVGFIPPGTQLEKRQFVIYPNGSIRLPGQPEIVEEASKTIGRKKPVAVDVYTYQPDQSPLQFRNYLTLSTDKDFRTEFHIDTKFWASDIRVMPASQLTGVALHEYESGDYTGSYTVPIPFKKPDGFYIRLPIQ